MPPASDDISLRPNSRRRFLTAGAALAGGTAGGADGPPYPPGVPPWSKTLGAPVLDQAYGVPSPYEAHVARQSGAPDGLARALSFTPLQDLLGIFTPAGVMFEHHQSDVPEIDPGQHRLHIDGLVERPTEFSMADILRMPSVSRVAFIECRRNTANRHGAATVQFSHGLLGCCEWSGVLLSTLLGGLGIHPQTAWLVADGADDLAPARSIPIAPALDEAILAYAQNGEKLRPEHGYPLRLVLPGYAGAIQVKWLRRLSLASEPSAPTSCVVQPVKSVITHPSGGQQLGRHGYYEIRGLAWSGAGRIETVAVSLDGGRAWQEARLQEPVLPKCLTRFRLPWFWRGTPALICSRAVDEFGASQTAPTQASAPAAAVPAHNAVHTWVIDADGTVRSSRE